MSASYVSYNAQGRPTREETMETIFETYIHLTRAMQKIENIYKREFNYRRKKLEKMNEQQ